MVANGYYAIRLKRFIPNRRFRALHAVFTPPKPRHATLCRSGASLVVVSIFFVGVGSAREKSSAVRQLLRGVFFAGRARSHTGEPLGEQRRLRQVYAEAGAHDKEVGPFDASLQCQHYLAIFFTDVLEAGVEVQGEALATGRSQRAQYGLVGRRRGVGVWHASTL